MITIERARMVADGINLIAEYNYTVRLRSKSCVCFTLRQVVELACSML